MPKIYVSCLASYNNGILHGRWVEASSDVEEMQEEVNAMMRESPMPDAEEWAIHDYEDMPKSLGEFSGLQAVADYVTFLEEHKGFSEGDLRAIYEEFGDYQEADEAMRDRFVTICASFEDYANEAADEAIACHTSDGEAPQFLINYFDYEAFARDLVHDHHVVDVPSGVAIFYC